MYDESVELYEQGVAARVTVVRGDPRQRPANPRGCRQPLAAPPTQPAPPAHQHPLVLATLGASRGRPPAVSAPPTSSSTPLFPPESKDRRRTGRYPHPQSPGLRGGAGLMAGASRRRAASNGCALLALLLLLIDTRADDDGAGIGQVKQQRDALLVRGNQPARPQPEVQIEPSDLTKDRVFPEADDSELEAVALGAMQAIRSREAITEKTRRESRQASWEASMNEKVDEYLQSVIEKGTPPDDAAEDAEVPAAASEARRLAKAAAESRREQATRKASEEAEANRKKGASEDKFYKESTSSLELAEQLLFLNKTERDVEGAVSALTSLAKWMEMSIPATPKRRRLFAKGRLQDGEAKEGPPYSPRPPPLSQTILKARDMALVRNSKSIARGGVPDTNLTKLLAGGDAAYLISALAASGIASPHVELNDTRAVQLLHLSAMTGSLDAHMALADRYFSGRGVPKSCSWGLYHAKTVADYAIQSTEETNNFVAPLPTVRFRDRWLDPNYVDVHQLENGEAQVEMEQDMARRGSAEAQRHLGFRRLLGQGLEADPDHAFREFQGAAAEGDAYAMFNLGYMYLRGVGTPQGVQDFGQAMRWFGQASERGLPAAYNGIGVMSFNGQGVEQNFTAARLAFEAGARGGDADSMYNLGTMYKSGIGTSANTTVAKKYFKDAYNAGHWRAGHSLALMAESGVKGSSNCTEAESYIREFIAERFTWVQMLNQAQSYHDQGDDWAAIVQLSLAAEQGCEQAEANLAYVLQRGSGYTNPDRFQLAMRMLIRSGKRGGSDSLVEAGHLALAGSKFGLPIGDNPELAVKIYRRSSEMGELEATFLLGWAHAHGIGVQRNFSAAAEFYQMAVDNAPHHDPALAPMLALLFLRCGQLLEALCSLLSWLPSAQPLQSETHDSRLDQRHGPTPPQWKRSDAEWDNVLLAVLVAALAAVLWIRWSRIQSAQEARLRVREARRRRVPSSEVQQNSPAGPQADRGPGPGPREALDSRDPRTESVEVIPTTVAPGNVDAVDTVQHEAANPMEDEATSDPGDDEVTDAGSLPIPGDDEASPHLASSDANRSVLARGSGQQ